MKNESTDLNNIDENYFDSVKQLQFSDFKKMFDKISKDSYDKAISYVNNFHDNYLSNYDKYLYDNEEIIYPWCIAEWADKEMAQSIVLENLDHAKPYYFMAGMFYESYWDLIWLFNQIIKDYKDYDPVFINECSSISGWKSDLSDSDELVIGGDQIMAEIDDFKDLELDINILDYQMQSELYDKIKEIMCT